MHVPVVVFSMSNRPDTCDSLHDINLASDVLSIAAIYFFRGFSYLTLRIYIYLAARHYDHMAAILILMNCYGITNLLIRIICFTENQTFFYTTKIWSHAVSIFVHTYVHASEKVFILHDIQNNINFNSLKEFTTQPYVI